VGRAAGARAAGEQLTPLAALRVALALAGAAIVLWPADGGGWPLPRTLGEWLGAGRRLRFALNNVMLRREAHQPEACARWRCSSAARWWPGVLALVLGLQGGAAWPPPAAAGWVAGALALAVVFLAGNLALQYGAARLPPT
jgi:drug/metabolite transporter (DMT)-like permease